jgi:hypothetical protein
MAGMSQDFGYEAPDKVPVALDVIAARRKRKLVHGIILSGWILTVLTMVAILGAAVLMSYQGKVVPETLSNWAGMALGFLFGTFTSIVKDFIADTPE